MAFFPKLENDYVRYRLRQYAGLKRKRGTTFFSIMNIPRFPYTITSSDFITLHLFFSHFVVIVAPLNKYTTGYEIDFPPYIASLKQFQPFSRFLDWVVRDWLLQDVRSKNLAWLLTKPTTYFLYPNDRRVEMGLPSNFPSSAPAMLIIQGRNI